MKTMSENTYEAFKTLSELYQMPKFNEKQDAVEFIENYNKGLEGYASFDVREACLTIFKWGKAQGFPTLSHILSELINKPKTTRDYKASKQIPEELKACYDDALILSGVCRRSFNIRLLDKIRSIYKKIAIPYAFDLGSKLERIFYDFKQNNKMMYDDDDFNFIYAFKCKAFDNLWAEIKQNMVYEG